MRLVEVLAAVGAITALVAGGYLAEEFGTGPALAMVSGLALLVTASLTARRIRRKVRYRVDRPNSTAWLAGKIAAVFVGGAVVVYVAWALEVPSLPRSLVVFALIGSLLAVVNQHAARWTLLQIDATGVKLGRTHLPWPAVARLDLAGAAPGLVEAGVRLAPGHVAGDDAVRGTVLTDLPATTAIPAAAADADRIRQAVAEFGDRPVEVVVRTP
ncbi:hypothetical protein [Lentzea cavernae]|uniref:hypothetical protein n=1 Tax=Lentzea cavernae TaxID=2020703 RepID=UPI00174A588D|nr:hypothetical protein [Lentzea cavernae]